MYTFKCFVFLIKFFFSLTKALKLNKTIVRMQTHDVYYNNTIKSNNIVFYQASVTKTESTTILMI